MRYLIEYTESGPPVSRWQRFWQRLAAWLILAGFVGLVVVLTVFFFSIVAAIVSALLIIGALYTFIWRLKYGASRLRW